MSPYFERCRISVPTVYYYVGGHDALNQALIQ